MINSGMNTTAACMSSGCAGIPAIVLNTVALLQSARLRRIKLQRSRRRRAARGATRDAGSRERKYLPCHYRIRATPAQGSGRGIVEIMPERPAVTHDDLDADLGLFGPASVSWRVHAEPILALA